jgi:hypothetical protein
LIVKYGVNVFNRYLISRRLSVRASQFFFFLSFRVALIEHNFFTQSSFLLALGSSFNLTLLISPIDRFSVLGHAKLTKESLLEGGLDAPTYVLP